VLIWGDSHAASLYRGIANHANNTHVAQYTASGCPPILEYYSKGRKECLSINSFVYRKIQELKPDILIMAANWAMYDGVREEWQSGSDSKLQETLEQLNLLGIQKIYLVGNFPIFTVDQPRIANKVFIKDRVHSTFYGFERKSRVANEQIKDFAKRNRVAFISPIDLLCNEAGCTISVSRSELIPLAFDTSHLTEAGATLLIELAIQQHMLSLS
jgi:hypothetical protein